jgi:hypothetical protein
VGACKRNPSCEEATELIEKHLAQPKSRQVEKRGTSQDRASVSRGGMDGKARVGKCCEVIRILETDRAAQGYTTVRTLLRRRVKGGQYE